MSIRLELVYENGVFRPLQPVALAEHQRVTATLNAPDEEAAHFVLSPEQWQAFYDALDAPPRDVPSLRALLTGKDVFDEHGSPTRQAGLSRPEP